jgi:hypothetical protein
VTHRQLPREHEGALSFDELIATLRLLEGEEVVLSVDAGAYGRLQVKGPLRGYRYGDPDPSWGVRLGFAVGDAGRLLMAESDFRAARLVTFDGNDYFTVSMTFGDLDHLIGDPDSHSTDEFDLFP